jgi:hypothetical protein
MTDTPDTPPPCCTPTSPHVGHSFDNLAPGVTHYYKTRPANQVVDFEVPVIDVGFGVRATDIETAAQLRARIDTALAALRPPHVDHPWHAWVNQGGFARKAHEARLALGALE